MSCVTSVSDMDEQDGAEERMCGGALGLEAGNGLGRMTSGGASGLSWCAGCMSWSKPGV